MAEVSDLAEDLAQASDPSKWTGRSVPQRPPIGGSSNPADNGTYAGARTSAQQWLCAGWVQANGTRDSDDRPRRAESKAGSGGRLQAGNGNARVGFQRGPYSWSVHFNTVADAEKHLDRDDEIVVYCSDPACVASQFAYRWLIDAGYTNVRRYPGGVSDWASAGYDLASIPGVKADPGLFFVPKDAYVDRRSDGST